MIRVAFGSVPKDGGTFTFYRNLRPELLGHGIDLRCVSVGREQRDLIEPAFVDEGCVCLAETSSDLKAQARAVVDWCVRESIDIVFGVNSPGILCALPHLPDHVRVLARCANGFDEGYRLTLVGSERLARIVALVPRLRDDLVAKYGVDPDLVVLIPNGTSPERFASAAGVERGQGAQIELGFLGRLEHAQKGVMHLPEVLGHLDRIGVPYRLSIAGKGKHETALREALATRVDESRVRFVGTLSPDEIPAFLAQTDIFLFPSHFEGCPNALLEAMMAGAVPVSWRLPGITDFLLREGETGLLAEIGDTERFACRIAELANDRPRLAQMSRAGSVAARKEFSTSRCARAYVDLFETVMGEVPPAWTPVPWSRFRVDPLFRGHPLKRFVPAKQRDFLRGLTGRLRSGGRPTGVPSAIRSAGDGFRVHQIINSFSLERGGAERLARQLHTELRAAGHDARLVALEACPTGDLEGALSLGLESPYDPRALLRLGAYARQIAPGDIVHVHLFPASAHVAALRRTGRLEGHLVFTEHSTSNRRRGQMLGEFIDKNVYCAFERIVAISDGVKTELLGARPWLSGRMTVIENGCSLLFESPTLRAKDHGPFLVASVGRLAPAKNYTAALEALARLGPRDVRYEIAGEGPERAALERRTRELGLGDRVEFLGHTSNIRAFLSKADVFLMPSLWEGFGLAAVEAMNACLPVVASDVAGLRDVVGTDGKAAILVNPTDPDEIAAALAKLLDDPATRRSLGEEGFKRSLKFDIARFVDAHLRLYDEVRRQPVHAA